MAEYTLYGFAQSGNCYKVALMLELAGADWTTRFVDYFNGETRSDAYRAAVNELGEVPVLEHGGRRLTQSGVILTYLAERTRRFGGRSDDERYEALRWILFDNHKFTNNHAIHRFQKSFMPEPAHPAVLAFMRGRAESSFAIVDKHLADRSFMLGERPTIADFSLAGYQYYEEETGIDRNAFPNLLAWTRRIAELPGWKHPYELMPRGSPDR